MDRRSVVTLGLAIAVAPVTKRTAFAQAGMSQVTAYAFSFPALSGDTIRLASYIGRPLLIVNTASQCSYTPQYAGLQELWDEFRERGLMVVGVPCNDFGGKEPGGFTEISETARQYGVTFPIAAKTTVVGHDAHPFYKWAAAARPKDAPHWNFHKYLIGRDGYISDVFPPAVEPANVNVKKAVARTLAYTRSATVN